MKSSTGTGSIVLARGEVLNLDGAEGARIVADRGTVWVTQDGDLRDIVLRDGESFELDRPTPAIVQAFERSTVTIAAPSRRPPVRGLSDWLRRVRSSARRHAYAWA